MNLNIEKTIFNEYYIFNYTCECTSPVASICQVRVAKNDKVLKNIDKYLCIVKELRKKI